MTEGGAAGLLTTRERAFEGKRKDDERTSKTASTVHTQTLRSQSRSTGSPENWTGRGPMQERDRGFQEEGSQG